MVAYRELKQRKKREKKMGAVGRARAAELSGAALGASPCWPSCRSSCAPSHHLAQSPLPAYCRRIFELRRLYTTPTRPGAPEAAACAEPPFLRLDPSTGTCTSFAHTSPRPQTLRSQQRTAPNRPSLRTVTSLQP